MMQMLRAWLVLALPCAAALNLLPQLRAAQPVLSRSSPLTMEAADDMASLQQQIERLQLQAKIKELQAQVSDFKPAAAPEPVPEVVVAPPPAVVAKVAEVVKAPEVVAPVAVPEVAAASPAEMADRIADAVKDAMPSFSMPSAAPDFAAAVPAADAATAGFNGANAPIAVAIAVGFLAVATVAVRAWVVFLMGGEDGEGGEAQAFMMGDRPLERSLADLPSSKEAPPMSPATAAPSAAAAAAAAGTGRSAPEILMGGLGNLGDAPFGWLFGKPSALYSTQPSADRLMWEEGNKVRRMP